jgi:hypothetical protein
MRLVANPLPYRVVDSLESTRPQLLQQAVPLGLQPSHLVLVRQRHILLPTDPSPDRLDGREQQAQSGPACLPGMRCSSLAPR